MSAEKSSQPWLCTDLTRPGRPGPRPKIPDPIPDRIPDRIPDLVPPHSSLENRSLVDFQEKNEQFIDHGAHFFFEHRSLVDFQIGNEA